MTTDRFVTTTRFAEICGVSLSGISKAKKAGIILMGEDRFYDLTHPKNMTYLHRETKKRDSAKRHMSENDKAILHDREIAEKIAGRGARKVQDAEQDAVDDYGDAMESKKSPGQLRRDRKNDKKVNLPYDGADLDDLDLSKLDKFDVDKLKVIEAIDSARLKNDQLRKTLIDRNLVAVVLGRIHTVDVQEFLAIPIRFAPVAAGLCGKSDEETIHALEKRLSSELYKCLNHVQRIIEKFLDELEDESNEPEA